MIKMSQTLSEDLSPLLPTLRPLFHAHPHDFFPTLRRLLTTRQEISSPSRPVMRAWHWLYLTLIAILISGLILLPQFLGWHSSLATRSNFILLLKYYGFGTPLIAGLGWWLALRTLAPKPTRYDLPFFCLVLTSSLLGYFFPYAQTGRHDTIITTMLATGVLMVFTLAASFLQKQFWQTPARHLFIEHLVSSLLHIGLIEIGGVFLSYLTLALYSTLNAPHFFNWYLTWIVPAGAISAVPVGVYLATHTDTMSNLTSVLTRIFNPLFLFSLTAYLLLSLFSGQNPYADRNLLLICNIVLVLIMGLIHLSLNTTQKLKKIEYYLLALLMLVSLVITAIAFGAISLRLGSYGFTGNRVVVLGTNLVIMGHLGHLLGTTLAYLFGKVSLDRIRLALLGYWGVYILWAIFVALAIPFLFQFA